MAEHFHFHVGQKGVHDAVERLAHGGRHVVVVQAALDVPAHFVQEGVEGTLRVELHQGAELLPGVFPHGVRRALEGDGGGGQVGAQAGVDAREEVETRAVDDLGAPGGRRRTNQLEKLELPSFPIADLFFSKNICK